MPKNKTKKPRTIEEEKKRIERIKSKWQELSRGEKTADQTGARRLRKKMKRAQRKVRAAAIQSGQKSQAKKKKET